MADDDKRKFDLPWGTLLPLLAVLAGVVAQYKPLVSERPPATSEKTTPVIAAQDVDARLWQDPIGIAQKQKALLDAQSGKDGEKESVAESHNISALASLLYQDAKTFPGNVLLLAVMLDAGPYSEQAESRLRARQAVLAGLSESGFVPVDGEHIGFVTRGWPPDPPFASEGTLLLPWEECEAIGDPKKVFPKGARRAVLVWLPAVNFSRYPLRRFAALIDQLAPADIRDKIDVKLIGPANSTGLQSMVREADWDSLKPTPTPTLTPTSTPPKNEASFSPTGGPTPMPTPAIQKALDGVWVISPRATAPDLALLSAAGVSTSSTNNSVKAVLEKEFMEPGPRGGLHFVRTIAPDDIVLREMIAELARRRVPIVSKVTADGQAVSRVDHVVILSEWDTPYGRSLSTTFAAEASWQNANDIIQNPEKRPLPQWIHSYHYLRGIDGQLPGELTKDTQREQGQKNFIRSRGSRDRGNGGVKSVGLSSSFGAADERR